MNTAPHPIAVTIAAPSRRAGDGRNPYDQAAQARTYPVGQVFPPYLPLIRVAHLPFGLVPHGEADALYVAAVVGLTAVLAGLAIAGVGRCVIAAGVLGLTAALLLSRPGEMNLLLGQVAAQRARQRARGGRPTRAGAGAARRSFAACRLPSSDAHREVRMHHDPRPCSEHAEDPMHAVTPSPTRNPLSSPTPPAPRW
jgi:hypothetical protein